MLDEAVSGSTRGGLEAFAALAVLKVAGSSLVLVALGAALYLRGRARRSATA